MPYQIAQNIHVFQSSIWQTNCSVILNEAANIIIDPCYFPVEIQIIADFVNRRRSFNKYIIFTHSDFDHVVGYQYFKGAKLIGQEEIGFCDQETQLIQLQEIDQTYYVNRKIPFVFPELDVSFTDQHSIPIKDDQLLLFHAPGHTGDSSFVISKAQKVMFAGDYLSDLEFPFVYFNTLAYLKSLNLAEKLIKDFEIEYVVPGHGDIATDKNEIHDRINWDKQYLTLLLEKAEELFVQGLQEKEMTEVLKDIRYKNEPIEGAMLKMHVENIKLILRELQTF